MPGFLGSPAYQPTHGMLKLQFRGLGFKGLGFRVEGHSKSHVGVIIEVILG